MTLYNITVVKNGGSGAISVLILNSQLFGIPAFLYGSAALFYFTTVILNYAYSLMRKVLIYEPQRPF